MEMEDKKNALHYLSEWGYGKGSNFNIGNVTGLMMRYADIALKNVPKNNVTINSKPNDEQAIEFASYVTGHDKKTIENMFNDWKSCND